jgi:bidirectional [NiFe] hydrogenase diaphorase subunit
VFAILRVNLKVPQFRGQSERCILTRDPFAEFRAMALFAPSLDESSADPRIQAVELEIKRQGARPDSLLEVLHRVQELYGHLPISLLGMLARKLRLPPSRVFGVATFYHFFTLQPKGRHTCVTCLGTACHIAGAAEVLTAIEAAANAKAGTTSSDGLITVQTGRCLGACGIAPMALFDENVAGHLSPAQARERIQEWRNERR